MVVSHAAASPGAHPRAASALDVREEPRRAGDPPSLIARADRVRSVLGWKPRYDDLDTIVRTSLEWERRQQREPW